MIVMDSHVLIWLAEGDERLGKRSRKVWTQRYGMVSLPSQDQFLGSCHADSKRMASDDV